MRYIDDDGERRDFYATTAERLTYASNHAPVGRLHAPASWKTNDVRNLEDSGLWTVRWVDLDDHVRVGSWIVTGVTEKGRRLLKLWHMPGRKPGEVQIIPEAEDNPSE